MPPAARPRWSERGCPRAGRGLCPCSLSLAAWLLFNKDSRSLQWIRTNSFWSTKVRQTKCLSITCIIPSTSPQTYKVDLPIVPILQMRKRRLREITLSRHDCRVVEVGFELRQLEPQPPFSSLPPKMILPDLQKSSIKPASTPLKVMFVSQKIISHII